MLRIYPLFFSCLFFLGLPFQGNTQELKTSLDVVAPLNMPFGYGVNPGSYFGWFDEDLATLSADVHLNTWRPTLPEHFLDFWGYDIRASAFQFYPTIGINNLTVFIGYPSERHRLDSTFCQGVPTPIFDHLYEPIWDDGLHGTEVNDSNYFALYVYKMVEIYKNQIAIYEVWNEPDLSFTTNADADPEVPSSWWNVPPDPCDYGLHAPFFYYVRMLRITYEIVKKYDPHGFVATGGIGNPTFLDAILRYSDHPIDGRIDTDHPFLGGAYFDVLSYHSYPHIDNSMRYWDQGKQQFGYERHSDRAVEGFLSAKDRFTEVLINHGFDGATYPEKHWIVTETNLPSKSFEPYFGSPEHQRNYIMKTMVKAQQAGIAQVHTYQLADIAKEQDAKVEFLLMGLYKYLDRVPFGKQQMKPSGVAYGTIALLLKDYSYDATLTQALQLPSDIDGAAFKNVIGHQRFVLWAKTTEDASEKALAYYSFPISMQMPYIESFHWDYSAHRQSCLAPSLQIALNGTPLIFEKAPDIGAYLRQASQQVSPNPIDNYGQLTVDVIAEQHLEASLYSIHGTFLRKLLDKPRAAVGRHEIKIFREDLSAGTYFVLIRAGDKISSVPFVVAP